MGSELRAPSSELGALDLEFDQYQQLMYGYCDHCERYDVVQIDDEFPQFQYCSTCIVLILTSIMEQTDLDDEK